MEDTIEVILQDHSRVLSTDRPHPAFSACLGALLTGVYGVWSLFATPGFRRVPWRLKVLDITCLFFFLIFFTRLLCHLSNIRCCMCVCVKSKKKKPTRSMTCTLTIICLFWSVALRASDKCGKRRKR